MHGQLSIPFVCGVFFFPSPNRLALLLSLFPDFPNSSPCMRHAASRLLRLPLSCPWRAPRSSSVPARAMRPSRGAFVVLEGGDRSGKSTQAAKLVASLLSSGVAADAWRFPDRTSACGQLIDAYLKASAGSGLDDAAVHLLFSANRWEKRRACYKATLRTRNSDVSLWVFPPSQRGAGSGARRWNHRGLRPLRVQRRGVHGRQGHSGLRFRLVQGAQGTKFPSFPQFVLFPLLIYLSPRRLTPGCPRRTWCCCCGCRRATRRRAAASGGSATKPCPSKPPWPNNSSA